MVECAAIAAILLSLVQRTLWPGSPMATSILLSLVATLLLLALSVNPVRWQVWPAVLVGVILLGQTAWAVASQELATPPGAPIVGVGLVLLAVSALLVWGMPAGRLPAPGGRYAVGVVTNVLTRPALDGGAARPLEIKAWYPASPGAKGHRIDPMWSDLRQLPDAPAPIRAMLAYLARIRTHSILGARPDLESGPHPLIVYNHSLVSFASENTLLMEHLASHGYIVVSIRHRDQAAEYAAIQAAVPKPEQARDRELLARLRKASSREERARLSLEQFRNSTGTSIVVRRRVQDSLYVLDHLDQALSGVPGGVRALASSQRFGALGLSLGGAVATQLCLIDARCVGAANLDGGLYGVDEHASLTRPYLMVYSQDNVGTNDAFRRSAVFHEHEQVLTGGKHLDLHDATVLLPGLKWFGLLGPGSGAAKSRRVQQMATSFFDGAFRASGADGG